MKSRMWKGKRLGTILAIALTGLLLVTACAPGPTLPVKGKVVEFGALKMLTGAAAADDSKTFRGELDYVRYFNEEQMIPGVTVEYVWRDSALLLERWASGYQWLKARGIPVIQSGDTMGIVAFQERLERDKIPLLSSNPLHELVYPPRWYYFYSSTWAEQFAVLAEYLMENWQEERPPRLACIITDSGFGRQPEIVGKRYAESLGFEVLPMEFVPHVPIDTTPQLLRMSERGADFVFIQGIIVTTGPILRDAERLGLWDKMQFSGTWGGMAPESIAMGGAASEGYLFPVIMPEVTETEIPGIKLMLDLQMKYHGELMPDNHYLTGLVGAAIVCEAIRRAVENVGYENVDGPAIKEALDSIKDFDVYGLVTTTYELDDHRGSNKIAISEVRGGETVRITDWRESPMLVPEE